jgi:hypothetical protein
MLLLLLCTSNSSSNLFQHCYAMSKVNKHQMHTLELSKEPVLETPQLKFENWLMIQLLTQEHSITQSKSESSASSLQLYHYSELRT